MSLSSIHAGLLGTALVATAAGCSNLGGKALLQPEATPVSLTRHGIDHGGAHYALGRYFQGQQRYDQAIEAYLAVLDADPDHAEAHNALGVIHAIQGRHALAEKELRTALSLAPRAAHIHNNLGYALLRQGSAAAAAAAFEEALRLDPAYARAADNLRIARAQLPGTAPQGRSAALAPPKGQGGGVPSPTPSLDTVPRLSQVAANIYQLEMPVARPQAAKVVPIPQPGQPGVRLEVANGNGVGGLAKQASRYLKARGYGTLTHITNQKPYGQKLTEIQFRPGFERHASELQALLAGKGVATQTSRLRQDVEIRLVLGQDLRRAAALAEAESEPASLQLAAAR